MIAKKWMKGFRLFVILTIILLSACGGGGGGDDGQGVPSSYAGKITQASISTTNVFIVTDAAWQSLTNSIDIGEVMPLDGTPGDFVGDCGGTASVEIKDISTEKPNGTIDFVGYCTMGTTLDGIVLFNAIVNLASMDLTQLKLTFNNLEISDALGSYTFIEGYANYIAKPGMSGETDIFDLVIRDNIQQKNFWLNDFILEVTYGSPDTATIKGRFYDYDNGYVDLSTTTPLTISDFGPTDGVLLFSGNKSAARIIFNPDLSTLLEIDSNGDGNFVKLNTSEYLTFVRQFLQFRTFENPASNHFVALVDYKVNGAILQPGEVLTARIFDPSGIKLDATLSFQHNLFTTAVWNPSLLQFTGIGTDGDSGYAFDLSSYTDLPVGAYRIEVVAADGNVLTSSLDFPGKLELPVVSASGMSYQWNQDGSLALAWNEPIGLFEQYRVVLTDQNNLGIFYGLVLPGVSQVTLQAPLIAQIKLISSPTEVKWNMQTRDYVDNNNYARGISDSVAITWP